MVPGRDAEFLGGLPPEVVNTITSAKAPSTRHAYRLNSNLFVDWCSSRQEDPRRCPIRVVLFFLQDGLERRLSPSTLKVYVAAIAEQHDAVDSKSVGKHDLVIRFLRGARKLNPPRPHLVPFWNLTSVLATMRGEPFEPLQSVELRAVRYDDIYRMDKIKSLSFYIIFYRLFRGVAKYIVYGNTFCFHHLSDCDSYTPPTTWA